MDIPPPDKQVPHIKQIIRENRASGTAGDGIYTLGDGLGVFETHPKSRNEIDEATRRAENGDREASYRVALFHIYNTKKELGERNPAAAINILSDLSKTGHIMSTFQLGLIFEEGIGVTPDLTKAIDLYETAARGGHLYAMYRLGTLYLDGSSIHSDTDKGKMWILAAAEGGVSLACELAAKRFSRSVSEKIAWLERAAIKGHTGSMVRLAEIYRLGISINSDPKQAFFWYKVAEESENPDIKPAVEKLAITLSEADRSALERRAQLWLEEHPFTPVGLLLPSP